MQAVLAHLRSDALVFDVDTLAASEFRYDEDCFSINIEGETWELRAAAPVRGWARRLAPQDWQRGVTLGSRHAVEKTAWLSLLGAIVRSESVEWLTDVDRALIAENKLHQLEVARRVGVPVPVTLLTNAPSPAAEFQAGDWVIKPLGPGHYFEEEQGRVFFAQSYRSDLDAAMAVSAPFLIQERLDAITHLRVVSVGERVWVTGLDADQLPLDWRESEAAHSSFEVVVAPDEVSRGALALNQALGLSYSSQDWIVTAPGRCLLIDVNPGGQWLFLPEPVATEVAQAIASWLEE